MAEVATLAEALRRWIAEAYEVWWTRGADFEHGGFHERLNHDLTPTDDARRARLHPRQMFAYSRASHFGWHGSPSLAVEHGLRFFVSHYSRQDGLIRPLVSPSGKPLSDDVVLYDQAFALFGLASAYASLGDASVRSLATDLHDRLHAQFAHASIGFHESLSDGVPLSSNSHMHLLEASLAWQEVDNDERWSQLSAAVVELAITHFIDADTGAVRELFDLHWQPAAEEQGRVVEPGHQFEWAWLLLRFAARSKDRRLVPAALRLIEIGESFGVDRLRRAAITSLNTDLSPSDRYARLWPQCERIKAACIAGEATGESRYYSIAIEAAQTLMSYLDTPLRGLWRDRLDLSGAFVDEPAPASSFYHIVSAGLELIRVAPIASPLHEPPTDCRRAAAGSAC